MFVPKIISTLKEGYTRRNFLADLTAGTIVGIVALPLAIAFAIASGVSPEKGLYTAIVAGFLISALGGSRVQIGGPTGAFVVIVYSIVAKYGIDGLTIATAMAGVILILMGLAKFGGLIKFIPYPIVTGFTSGIAVIIFSSQVKDFLGLRMGAVPSDFVEKWFAYGAAWSTVNLYALGVGAGSLLVILLWPRISSRIPGSLVAIVLATVVVQVFQLPVDTITSRFGEIPSSLPAPSLPVVTWERITELVLPATTIAFLAGIESLLSAVVADGMAGGRHRSNMELVAQGAANIASSIFGGIPATGAIARTVTNVKNGARTPVAGIVHAMVLLLIMLLFGRWAGLIPLAALAAVLVRVAIAMSEYDAFIAILKGPRADVMVLVVTFLLTVIFDLTVAIEIGMIMAALIFMKQMADVSNVRLFDADIKDAEETDDPNAVAFRDIPAGVQVFEINGPFFFGSVDKFHSTLSIGSAPPKVLIIRMRNVPYMDAGGLHALEELHDRCKKNRIQLLISDIHAQPLFAATQSGFIDVLGENLFFGNLDDALDHAREVLQLPRTAHLRFEPTVAREKE
ncbi:MAG: STAS domain-containing protein [Ignavibacteriae bacterium]|nr:STAS domain-containing protein [Ignavibacteriota bacterium]